MNLDDFLFLFFFLFFFNEVIEPVDGNGIFRFLEFDRISKDPLKEVVGGIGDDIVGLVNLEVESIGVIEFESFLGFGLGLDVLDFEDFDIESSLLDDGIDFLEVLVGVHVLKGVVGSNGLDLDGVYFFARGVFYAGLVVHFSYYLDYKVLIIIRVLL